LESVTGNVMELPSTFHESPIEIVVPTPSSQEGNLNEPIRVLQPRGLVLE
jgi:hypothetical protein